MSFQQLYSALPSVEEAVRQLHSTRAAPWATAQGLVQKSAQPRPNAVLDGRLESQQDDALLNVQQRHTPGDAASQQEARALTHARKEVANLRTQLRASEQARYELQNKQARLTSEAESRSAHLKMMQQQTADARSGLQAAESTSQQLRAKVNSLERALNAERSAMSKRAQELEQALDSSRLELSETKASLQSTAHELRVQQREAGQAASHAAASIAELRTALNHAQTEALELRRCQEDEATSGQHSAQQLSKLRDTNAQLKADLREAEALLRRADEDRCMPPLNVLVAHMRLT